MKTLIAPQFALTKHLKSKSWLSGRVNTGRRYSFAVALIVTALIPWTMSAQRPFPSASDATITRPTPGTVSALPPKTPEGTTSTPCANLTKTVFVDDKFTTTDWDTSLSPGGQSIPGYATTFTPTGGNPAEFRRIEIAIQGNAPNYYFIHLLKGQTFDPAAEGAIVSLEGGYDIRNETPQETSTSFALLLHQDGKYFRGPPDNVHAKTWSTFNHPGLKATNFVNLSKDGPQNPNFSCDGKPIQIGFVALSGISTTPVRLIAGIDNWSIRFNSTCCPGVSNPGFAVTPDKSRRSTPPSNLQPVISATPGNAKLPRTHPDVVLGPVDPKLPSVLSDTVTSACCCDDEGAVVDNQGTVILPANVDMDSPPVFEYVEQDLGDVSDLYPGADTSLDTWYQKYPCKPAVGGYVPPDAANWNLDVELVDHGIVGVSGDDIIKQIASWEQLIRQKETKLGTLWKKGRVVPKYTPPLAPFRPRPNTKYAFGGRDIVFVHGLKVEHLLDRIKGDPKAKVDWKHPGSFPADSTNPEFYTGYYHDRAVRTWSGAGAPGMGGHIAAFLRNKGYNNRFLIVSYNCSERLDVAVRSVLAQIGDAMVFGTGVVDPLNPDGPPPKNFGTPSFVVVSHSTGGLVTDMAMTAAVEKTGYGAGYIAKYCKAHIAAQGAHRGSRFATAAIALSGYSGIAAPHWLWPLVRQALVEMHDPPNDVPLSPFGFSTLASSILVDLVPTVSEFYATKVPVRTLTVAGGHPTAIRATKFILQPGFDDGAVNINSQVGNPNQVLLWPSGFRTDSQGLAQNFDLGVFGIGPNNNTVPVNINGQLFSFSVSILNSSLSSPNRAVGYYINQKADRVSSPANVASFPLLFFLAAGATPYISPTGMIQTIAAEYGKGSGVHPSSANPLNRYPNFFSFIQSASDHFKGTHDQFGGFEGDYYGYSPLVNDNSGEKNFEETRVLTDPAVYVPFAMPYGDNQPLLHPQNIPHVHETIRGLRVTFTLKLFKKKWTKSLWVWKRRYHLLDGWQNKRQFDYVYESVLKN